MTSPIVTPDDPSGETAGPEFGLLSQPYPAAVIAMRRPHRAPPISDPRITEGLTEVAHAERLAEQLHNQLGFDHQRRTWLTWDRYRWVDDKVGVRYRLAIEAARNLYFSAMAVENLKTREAVANFSIHCESRRVIENVLELMKHLPGIADPGTNWNGNPEEINTPSGLVNLRTGRTRDATPDDRVTFATSAMYNPSADCSTWERTVLDVMDGNVEMAQFLKRAFGYTLTGETREQVYFHAVGEGGNGKSTTIDAVASVVGDYSAATPFSTFEAGQRSSIGNDVAALPGKRLVSASEVNSGTKLNTARIKALTGGDRLSARHLYGNFFEFHPVCKLWLGTNHRPRIADDSYGIWRRILLVPFNRKFSGSSDDKALKEKLAAEGEGILRWCIEGAQEWYRDGLNPPALVREAVRDYERTSDPLADFLDERCDRDDPTAFCRASELFAVYGRWCEALGIGERSRDRLSLRAFGEAMKAKVIAKKRNVGVIYIGIRVKE